ncbi:MAG: hypothetical protein RLZZ126_279 [Pseudomonadota bacterium]
MTVRLHCDAIPQGVPGFDLPASAARHVQVMRLQPGANVTLFDGGGGEWSATVTHMGRKEVSVCLGEHRAIERESPLAMHLAVGMPANERMDWLVEKATELGVASVQPLQLERSVLRLSLERATKRQLHWQGIAQAACEQCGRNRVPVIHPVRALREWLESLDLVGPGQRWMLSLDNTASVKKLSNRIQSLGAPTVPHSITLLSGPEGGLSLAEMSQARDAGFSDTDLGARVLRAETAAIAAMAALSTWHSDP